MNNDRNFEALDIITILSFMLGLDNYRLNNQQSQQLMKEMSSNQDSMLEKIIKQNEILIAQNEILLKELKNLKK